MNLTKLFEPAAELQPDERTLKNGKLCAYYFTILYTRGAICNLYSLNAQLPGGPWVKLIGNQQISDDGEISIRIGDFLPGTVINMVAGIQAMTDIPAMAVFIVNTTTNQTVKLEPKTGNKTLAKGAVWNIPVENYPLQA